MAIGEKSSSSAMVHIPPQSLTSLPPRLSYTLSFLSFRPSCSASNNAAAPYIAPQIPTVLDAVYSKLLSYDITAASFLPPTQASENSDTKTPTELSLTHAHILRQKTFLKAYLLKIASNKDWSPNASIWTYMDKVAFMHTGVQRGGKRPELRVEYMQLGLLLGYVADIVTEAVMGVEDLDVQTRTDVVRAWSKVLWIQNDLFARRYVVDRATGERPVGFQGESGEEKKRVWEIVALLALAITFVWIFASYRMFVGY